MTQPRHDIQYLLDRAAIHDLHVRYFQGVDLGDEAQVRSCYTHDVIGNFHGRPTAVGLDALIAAMPSFPKQASGEWKISTHFMGNLIYKQVEERVAETETNAFALLVLTDAPSDRVAVRSLRYLDRLVRLDAGWRISERLHTLDWSCQVPTDFAATLAQRKQARPPAAPER